MGYHLSTCPYCSSGCGLLLHLEHNRIIGSHPSVVHPVSRGSLCMRGWNCVEAPADKGRLTRALARKNGQLVPVEGHAAIEEIARRLEAVGHATSSGHGDALFVLGPTVANEDLVAAVRLSRFLDAGVCGAETSGVPVARRALRTVLCKGYSARSLDTLADADIIWLFGVDADNYPQIGSRLVRARRKGAAIVQFDIYQAAESPGFRSIAVPPGNFPVVPLLLQRAAFDADVVPPRLRSAPQFATLTRPLVPGRGWLASDHPWMTDGQARDIVEAFRAANNPAVVVGDRWLSSVAGEEQTIQLLQALVLLGAEDRVVMATGEANSWGNADLLERVTGRKQFLDLLDPAAMPSIRAVVIVGVDLLRSTPRPDVLARRLADMDTVVVIDRFETACLPYAHVVLPSTVFTEQDGCITNSLGMVQRWRRLVPPPGAARSEREWFEVIGRASGMRGWPSDTRGWLDAMAAENGSYRVELLEQLYVDSKTIAVSLDERGSVNFVEPSAASTGMPRASDFPLAVHFRPHPAAWSTGVLSGREQLLSREARESTLRLSPGDMERAGLRDGATAKVVTPHGDAILIARADPSLPDGVSLATVLPETRAAKSRTDIAAATMAADGGEVSPWAWSSSGIQGFYPDTERQAVAIEPVPCRIEKV